MVAPFFPSKDEFEANGMPRRILYHDPSKNDDNDAIVVDQVHRRAILNGGTLGSRVLRLQGTGHVLETMAQRLSRGVAPQEVFAQFHGMFSRERSYPADRDVLRRERAGEDAVWINKAEVCIGFLMAANGIDTNADWDCFMI